jgi:hypothetical protein
MKTAPKLAAAAVLGLSAATMGASAASAAIVCNADHQCWHVHHHYSYRPEYGVVVHRDNWRWGPREHYTWREHAGRGYWRNGVWVRF